jgi:hypothetical protein
LVDVSRQLSNLKMMGSVEMLPLPVGSAVAEGFVRQPGEMSPG